MSAAFYQPVWLSFFLVINKTGNPDRLVGESRFYSFRSGTRLFMLNDCQGLRHNCSTLTYWPGVSFFLVPFFNGIIISFQQNGFCIVLFPDPG